MKGLQSAAIVLMIAVPATAFAHGASRLKMLETIEINAPAAKVWKVIGNFQDMNWRPGVMKTTGTGGNTPNVAKRVLLLAGGATINESLYKYDAQAMTYSYFIDKVDVKVFPVNNYSSTISVESEPGGKSRVKWLGAFFRGDPLFDPPLALNDDAATKAVKELYVYGLETLKQRIEAAEATH